MFSLILCCAFMYFLFSITSSSSIIVSWQRFNVDGAGRVNCIYGFLLFMFMLPSVDVAHIWSIEYFIKCGKLV